MTIFIFVGGGYSVTLGFGLCANFHFLWGGILKLSDLDSVTIFIGGGGILKLYFRIGGILPHFGPKFQPLQQAHASQIVSHILRMWRLINTSSHININTYYMKILAFTLENTHGMSAVQVGYNSRTIFCTFLAVVFNAL